VAGRKLAAVFYGVADHANPPKPTQFEVHQHLKKIGLPVFDDEFRKRCHDVEEILHFAHQIEKKELIFL